MLVLLDSTVLIDFLRGRPAVDRVRQLRDSSDIPATTAINVEEIVRGMKLPEESGVRALLDGLEILGVDRSAGWLAGAWRREHAARGTTLSQADCLIAATAHLNAARLCTGNPTGFPMPEVKVEHWPVGR